MTFGQVVIGPPGSGKTTYCNGLQQYLTALGRKVAVINLDPANDALPYEAAVDISDLVHLGEVMEQLNLGPNGGLLYCMEYVAANLDWLDEKLQPLIQAGCYLLLDFPGQVELFSVCGSTCALLDHLARHLHCRLAAVHLVDAHLCTDAPKYISALLLSLGAMLHLELPHVNVLSKIDLAPQYGTLAFNLDYYTEVQDLQQLLLRMGSDPFMARHRQLSANLCDVVEDFGLVSFVPLTIQDRRSVERVLAAADKACGYVFASLAGQSPYPPEFVFGSAAHGGEGDLWQEIQERYLDGPVVEHEQPAAAAAVGAGAAGQAGPAGTGKAAAQVQAAATDAGGAAPAAHSRMQFARS